MKNKQVLKAKEIEMCAINKKYPTQINMYTDEVKNLVAKRLEYLNKLNINRKSVSNLKSYLAKLIRMWSEIVNSLNKNKISNYNSMEEELDKLKEEMNRDEEDILESICKENLPYDSNKNLANEISENQQKNSKHLIKYSSVKNSENSSNHKKYQLPQLKAGEGYLPNIFTTGINTYGSLNKNLQDVKSRINLKKNSKSPEPSSKSQHGITSHSTKSPKIEYKGIFSNYEYLHTKSKKSLINNKMNVNNQSPEHGNNSIEETQNENSLDKEHSDFLTSDYENTKNNDFSRLLKKRLKLEKINEKLEKNLKEVEKIFDKKYKDLNNTTEHNQKKLHLIQKVF